MTVDTNELAHKARDLRRSIIGLVHGAKAGHIGGALSCADILTVLYHGVMSMGEGPTDPRRDRFVLSKGHACEGLYCILRDLGYITDGELRSFMRHGGLGGHPHSRTPGVEHPTGSLGHGLSVSVGMALAVQEGVRVFCVTGDGELAEGSVWEAAMAGAHYGLENLTCIVDANGLQIAGPTDTVMSSAPLVDKWRAFGWSVREIDGHDIPALYAALSTTPWERGKPNALVARTVKGKGCGFMEGDKSWHHRVPTDGELEKAYLGLGYGE